MKAILIFCFVSLVTCQFGFNLSPEDLQELMRTNRECQKETGAKQTDIMATLQGRFSEDPALKAHITCIGQKLGFIDENGTLQKDEVSEKLLQVIPDQEKVNRIMSKCLIQKNTPEDTAFDSIKCFSDNRKMIMPQLPQMP